MSSKCDFSVEKLCSDINAFRTYAARMNKHLVIRHHPNLAALGSNRTNTAILNSVDAKFSSCDNVKIFAPESSVNSYSLAKNSFVCVAPNSSLYYQLNLSGIPCLKSTDSIYLNLDSGIRTYATGNIDSITFAVNAINDDILTKKFVEELQKVIFTYLFRWSALIPGFKFDALNPSIDTDEYVQNGATLVSAVIGYVLNNAQPKGPIVLK